MRYTAEFNSIDSRSFRIVLESQTPGAERTVKLSGSPFTTSVKGDGKHLYSPIRCGGATVGLLSESYIFDLYSGSAKGVSVKLYEGDTIRWTGYTCPTSYDQGFDDYFEDIDIDCVDGLAVLKDIPFRVEGTRGIETFHSILHRCLRESGCYRNFYVSDNVLLERNVEESIVERLRVSTSNFFDERDSPDQGDDDIAWSCYEVLSEVCRFLGYTAVSRGDEVFIIDYDAIKSGFTTYYRYSLASSNPGAGEKVRVALSKDIKASDYASNGTKLILDDVYNKISVKDEFSEMDSLFPNFGDIKFENNLTAPEDSAISRYKPDGIGKLLKARVFEGNAENGFNGNFFLTLEEDWAGNYWLNVIRFYDSHVFNFHKYSGKTDVTSQLRFSEGHAVYSDMQTYNGAYYMRIFSHKLENGGPLWNSSWEGDALEVMSRMARYIGFDPNPTKISLRPMVLFMNQGTNRLGPGDGRNYNTDGKDGHEETQDYPFMSLKNKEDSAIFGGANHVLRIKGKFRYHDEPATPHPLTGSDNDKLKRSGDYKYWDQGFIWCKVNWGKQWWNGETWQSSSCWFKLFFWENSTHGREDIENKESFDKDFSFCNFNTSLLSLGEEGYIIPCPDEENLQGTAEIAFTTRDMFGRSKRSQWKPKGTKDDNLYARYFSKCVFLTDLEVTCEVSTGGLDDADLDSDTVYTNVIENGSVSKMEDITFKICTDDGKKPSYSSVDIVEQGKSVYLRNLFNRSLFTRQGDTTGCDGDAGKLRQEEHMVFKLSTQYSDPRIIFECTLHNEDFPLYATFSAPSFAGKTFVVTDMETDWRFNECTLKLTEKA